MPKLNVRLPDDLHAALTDAAAEDERSLNGEILWLLRDALERRSNLRIGYPGPAPQGSDSSPA
jgi:hypothetical protein